MSPCPKAGRTRPGAFCAGLLGLREIPKPEALRVRGGVWFDAGGLDIHVSVEEQRGGADVQRHFGLECAEQAGPAPTKNTVDGLRARLRAAGIETDD